MNISDIERASSEALNQLQYNVFAMMDPRDLEDFQAYYLDALSEACDEELAKLENDLPFEEEYF